MKWFSGSGEFAFLSLGGNAQGIIAIGGVAHGVIAIGGIASAGVISIGMNAIGSVAALGMNAVAPISLSLINGLGIYTAAGVNGWGAWSKAGTNASGLSSHGGVNSDYSLIPAVVVIAILIVASSFLRGARQPRNRDTPLPFHRFVRSAELREARVGARLVAVREDAVELTDRGERLAVEGSESLVQRARALLGAGNANAPRVVANLVRVEELMPDGRELSYRERAHETKRLVLRCLEIALAPERESWLPKDRDEVQWAIAWSARVAAVVSIGAMAWALR